MASDSRVVSPPSRPPTSAPPNLPTLATTITAPVNSSSVGSISVRRSMPRPATAKNTGLKKARMKPRSSPSICSVRIGDWPIRMPATKAPSAVCTPISSVVSAMPSMTTRMAVITGTSIVMWSLTQTISRATSRRPIVRLTARNRAVSGEARADGGEIDRALGGDACDHCDDDPGDGVVEDGGGEDQLADVATDDADLHQGHGDDLDRGDRQRGAEEQRGHQRVLVRRNDVGRQRIGERHAADERHGNARQRRRDHGAPPSSAPAPGSSPCRSAAAAAGCRSARSHRSCS